MEEYTLPSIIKELIIKYHKMESGDFIENHIEIICLHSNFIISRKSLKHIVEQRKTDKYNSEDIISIFDKLVKNIINNNIEIYKNKKDLNSKLILEKFVTEKTSLVVVVDQMDDVYIIKTGFLRASNKINKIKKQK